MGFFDKIKNWLRKLTARKTAVTETKFDQSAMTVGLIDEHTELSKEYEQIRLRLVEIDDKLNMGEIEAAEHDWEYRQQLARACQIRLRQMEIREKLTELGNPIPEPTQ